MSRAHRLGRAAARPPNASRMARWACGFSRPRWSNWPCTSTRRSPIWRSRAPLTGVSLTKARLRPSAVTTRRRISSSSSGIAFSSRISRNGPRLLGLELGHHRALLGTGADQPPVAAAAQGQAQRIEDDRLAGTGLAGERRQAAARSRARSRSISTMSRIARLLSIGLPAAARAQNSAAEPGAPALPSARAAGPAAARRSAGTSRCRGNCSPAPRPRPAPPRSCPSAR